MSPAAILVARLLEQRESWCDLGDDLKVKVRRPAEAEWTSVVAQMKERDIFLECVVDWQGFSEATLFGGAVGSSDPLQFDASVWMTAARDRGEWVSKVMEHVCNAMNARHEQRKDIAKN